MEFKVGSISGLISNNQSTNNCSVTYKRTKPVYESHGKHNSLENFSKSSESNLNQLSVRKRKNELTCEEDENIYTKKKSKHSDDIVFQNVEEKKVKKKKQKDHENNFTVTNSQKKKKIDFGSKIGKGIESKDIKNFSEQSRVREVDRDSQNVAAQEKTEYQRNAERRIKNKFKKSLRNEEEDMRTVFVGNLPNTYTKLKVFRLFSAYGEIESARLRCAATANPKMSKKLSIIKKEFHDDRTNISAYVKFKEKESAITALIANGSVIDGHHIRVDLVYKPKDESVDRSKAIFIGNLPFVAEEEDLWKFFEDCGTIESVRIIRDKVTSVGKGIAYVNFENSASVELALNLNQQELKGRELRISRCKAARKMRHRLREETSEKFNNKHSKFNNTPNKQHLNVNKESFNKDKSARKMGSSGFSGSKAMKEKKKQKKKKLSHDKLRKNKLVKLLTAKEPKNR